MAGVKRDWRNKTNTRTHTTTKETLPEDVVTLLTAMAEQINTLNLKVAQLEAVNESLGKWAEKVA